MRPALLRGASVIVAAIVMVTAFIWLLRNPPDDIIPVAFRGHWLDQGAECRDIDAQVRITGSTIDYDHLSFKADGLVKNGGDVVLLTGESFPLGKTERETVELRMHDHRATLLISAPDLHNKGPFVRCSADSET